MEEGVATRFDQNAVRSDLSVLLGAVRDRVKASELVLLGDVTVAAPLDAGELPDVDDEALLATDGEQLFLVRRTRFYEGTTTIPRAQFEQTYGRSPRLERQDGVPLPGERLTRSGNEVVVAPHTVLVACVHWALTTSGTQP